MNQRDLHIIRRLKQQPRLGMPATDPNDALQGFNDILKTIGTQSAITTRGLQAVIGGMQTMVEQVREATANLLMFEDRNKDLADTLGMTINNATRLGGVLDAQAKSFGVGGAKLRSYAKNLQGLIGNFATMNRLIETDYGKKLFNTQKIIQSTLKLSGDQANKYTQYVAGIGKDLEEQLALQFQIGKALDDATGTTGNFREIVAEIAGLTEDLQMQYGRIPGRLELGVAKAKALGMEMEDLNKAGTDLLDIETSIGEELEYQLISGRRLVDEVSGKSLTNAYREATLQGDASKQADIMNQLLEQEGETLKNNLFARQQMSTLLGTDEATLARALQKKSILESLPGGDALFDQTGEELMQAAKAMGATEEQLQELEAAEDRRTTDEKISDLFDVMTTTGITAIVKNPADLQAALAAGVSGAAEGATSLVSPLATADNVNIAGAAVSIKTGADMFVTAVETFRDVLLGNGTFTQFVPEQAVDGKPAKFAEGGVVPGGYPNDTYPALLTSGETVTPAGGFDQFAALIVAAINRQTQALVNNKFGGGLNAPYYG